MVFFFHSLHIYSGPLVDQANPFKSTGFAKGCALGSSGNIDI